jgi:hypothetical protein
MLEKHGKELFLQAPAFRTRELGEGVLVQATEHWLDFARRPQKRLLAYFKTRFPKVML